MIGSYQKLILYAENKIYYMHETIKMYFVQTKTKQDQRIKMNGVSGGY